MSSRKPKNLPKLPMSAFSPPNSGVSESFPLPPSPSTVHPARVIDADAAVSALATWKDNAPQAAKEVIVATDGTLDGLEAQAADAGVSIVSVQIPFDLKSGVLPSLPITSLRISLRAAFAPAEEPLAAALRAGHVIDLEVDLKKDPDVWGTLEEVIGRAATTTEGEAPIEGKIVLGGLLPPPHDLSLPLVQLLKDKTYIDYQGQVASISLLPGTFIKFLPPNWDAPIPDDEKEKKEWKRRIKMYLGPVVEAFGFERIIFGSGRARVADWYALARESFAELGVDQDAVDAIFGGNAARVYGPRDEA